MDNYTKEYWIEYSKNRAKTSQGTKDFIKSMMNNPTLLHRKKVEYDNYFMVTGFVCYDMADKRRMGNRDKTLS